MSRFDYVKYDQEALDAQAALKQKFGELEQLVTDSFPAGRPQSLVLTKLEEAYMWCGKGIRDDQISRNGFADLQEGRGNE
jgi:hypothetical protein